MGDDHRRSIISLSSSQPQVPGTRARTEVWQLALEIYSWIYCPPWASLVQYFGQGGQWVPCLSPTAPVIVRGLRHRALEVQADLPPNSEAVHGRSLFYPGFSCFLYLAQLLLESEELDGDSY